MINIEDYAGNPGVELGIMSPYKKTLPTSENKKRMVSLLKDLNSMGLTNVTISKGWYEGSFEMSTIIVSNTNLRERLVKLATKYDQESFIVKPKGREDAVLIFTEGGEIPLGTFEKMTPDQAHKSVSKSQPVNVVDWYWRYSTPEEKFDEAPPLKNTIVSEKMVVKPVGESEYARLVERAYADMPTHDAGSVKYWKALNDSNHKLWGRLLSKVKVVFTTESGGPGELKINDKSYEIIQMKDPYSSQSEMKDDVKKNNRIYISLDHSQHPVFTTEDNVVFRTVHDYIVHVLGGKQFGLHGELQAYNLHAKLATSDAKVALFTEVVGQVCSAIVNGDFPVQKVCAMVGFDYDNVGVVSDEIRQKYSDIK